MAGEPPPTRAARPVILELAGSDQPLLEQAAVLLAEHFEPPQPWPSLESARAEVDRVLDQGFVLAAVLDSQLLGWIGGLPDYDGRVVELHPLVTDRRHRRQGIGRALVEALASEAGRRGALTITLGTDDLAGHTSLSGIDLYDDVTGHLAAARDHSGGHPMSFYRALGFVVTGVVPDANGRGRPDILMSRRIARPNR
jgi:aminoglycoside 6'-N-acetyltransferase I